MNQRTLRISKRQSLLAKAAADTLNGLRILNTRPKHQAQVLSKNISDAGGISIECPALEIKETDNEWIQLLPDLNTVHHAIFISANAVHYCFTKLYERKIHWPTHINVIAIGQGSASALKQYPVQTIEIPDVPNSERLLALDILQQIKNKTVLLFKGEGGRVLIEEGLMHRGAHVQILPVYQRTMPEICPLYIQSIWRDDLVDIILLTSEQAMHNLFTMSGEEAHEWIRNKPCLVISERLAKSASLLGMKKIIISHPDGMMNTLLYFARS